MVDVEEQYPFIVWLIPDFRNNVKALNGCVLYAIITNKRLGSEQYGRFKLISGQGVGI
jgi:hypothetical protein